MKNRKAWKMATMIFVLGATTAIAVSAQTFTTLVSFDGTDGALPIFGPLAQSTDGDLYGTTFQGGTNNAGTTFSLTRGGKLTTLYSFCANTDCSDGSNPLAGLTQVANALYGTTEGGGVKGAGTVFKITAEGTLTTLHSFDYADGASPVGGLVQGIDGNLYGTTEGGGVKGAGTVFKITAAGMLSSLYSFCNTPHCADGNQPSATLVQATDGEFYGTTADGGANNNNGTVFKITPAGTLTTLRSFGGTDGSLPLGALVQASDGRLYGTTEDGGANNCGTIFRITLAGRLTVLHSFASPEGCYPRAGLVQATDGNLYGTASGGGTSGDGTIFKITLEGALTTVYSFPDEGSFPEMALVQATNGTLYGTTYGGGAFNDGTAFSLSLGLGPFVTFVRAAGKVGQTGGILGQGFTGTTSVSLNGISADFTVVSDTFIKATVPAGATTGYVTVTTPSGTLTSNVPFQVIK